MAPGRGILDGGADANIGATAAEVARHGGIDVGVGGRGRLLEQGGRRHDLTGLTIAALRHVVFAPGLLQRVHSGRIESLDGGDRRVADR